MKITVLCENTVGRLIGSAEHGFSAFIETHRGNYLFDTGNGHAIIANSLEMNKDLKSIRRIFLSHGHSDHTGGLPEVLKLRGKVDVHVHPHLFRDRFKVFKEGGRELRSFAGVIYKKEYLECLGANFIFNTDFTEVEKGIYLTGEVPRRTAFEKLDPKLFSKVDAQEAPDSLPDDQSLVLRTEKGLVVVLGCAHSGIINILNHIMDKTGEDRFHSVLGGTHLDFLDSEQLEESIKALKRLKIEKIGVSHCTGMRAASRLQQEFGERFFYGYVGSVFDI